MIIGKGYIARLISNIVKTHNDLLIFASGVSNSRETNENEYQREINLLQSVLKNHSNHTFVYFSTVSTLDPSLQCLRYIKHKKFIEQYISELSDSFIILRLPNIITNNFQNKHLFIPFFIERILARNNIVLYTNAYRYFIGELELIQILNLIFQNKNNFVNHTINVVLSQNPFSVKILFEILIKTIHPVIPPQIVLQESGSFYTADINLIYLKLLENNQIPFFNEKQLSEYQLYIEKNIKEIIQHLKIQK